MIKKLFKRIWKEILYRLGISSRPYKSIIISDYPDSILPRTVYVLESNGYHYVALFKCPCGCLEDIGLNLLSERRPSWSISIDQDKIPTLSPSIHRIEGCRSHFFLVKGEIEWC